MATQHSTPIGARFSRLEIIGEVYRSEKNRLWYVKCKCDCGVIKDIMCKNIVGKHTVSCGCYQRSIKKVGNLRHGKSKTPAWRAFYSMIDRCTNEKNGRYPSYGGRGIRVCDKWMRGFEFFYADMGDRPDGTTLDRIDVNGGYSPENCRWASNDQQSNNKQDSRFLEFKGVRQTIAQWAKKTGIDRACIEVRLGLGWSIEKTLTTESKLGRNQFEFGVPLEFMGKSQTFHEWAEQLQIPYATLKKRIGMGWTVERTLTEPLHRKITSKPV